MRYLTPPRGLQFTFFISFLAFGEELEKICFMMCLSDLMLLCSLVLMLAVVEVRHPHSQDPATLLLRCKVQEDPLQLDDSGYHSSSERATATTSLAKNTVRAQNTRHATTADSTSSVRLQQTRTRMSCPEKARSTIVCQQQGTARSLENGRSGETLTSSKASVCSAQESKNGANDPLLRAKGWRMACCSIQKRFLTLGQQKPGRWYVRHSDRESRSRVTPQHHEKSV